MAVNAESKADKSQERFYDALRELFVGAKVEGESGFINLMRIKSRYYTDGVFPKLQKDIDSALKPFPGFRQELFDKLYDFFHRYFSPSGSIYFQHTPAHRNIYEKVYTDDRDVVLFWKTHMLYYVKTDRLFNSLEVEVDDRKFFFDASTLEHKRSNEKRELVYEFTAKRIRRIKPDSVVFEDGTVIDLTKKDFGFFKLIEGMVW
jgi:adenine-specific DNA-methyltransferase